MATLDQVKDAMKGTFFKDLARFEPGKQGIVIGENVRIAMDGENVVVRFLAGTPPAQRKIYEDRLSVAKIEFTRGPSFRA